MRPCEQQVSSSIHHTRRPGADLADVNTRVTLAQRVPVAQLRDNGNRVEASVLSERCGDNLQGIRVSLEAVRLHTLEGVRILREES